MLITPDVRVPTAWRLGPCRPSAPTFVASEPIFLLLTVDCVRDIVKLGLESEGWVFVTPGWH